MFAIGLYSFNNIDDSVTSMNRLQMDQATMIDADPDAYKAYMAVTGAMNAKSMEALDGFKSDATENLQQTHVRIIGPSQNFSNNMTGLLDEFKTSFAAWEKTSNSVLDLVSETLGANQCRGIRGDCLHSRAVVGTGRTAAVRHGLLPDRARRGDSCAHENGDQGICQDARTGKSSPQGCEHRHGRDGSGFRTLLGDTDKSDKGDPAHSGIAFFPDSPDMPSIP